MTFFLDSKNDTLILDARSLFESIGFFSSCKITVEFESDAYNEHAQWLAKNFLINSAFVTENNQSFSVYNYNVNGELIFIFKILSIPPDNFNINLRFNDAVDAKLYIKRDTLNKTIYPEEKGNVIDSKLASFALAKTNPKLTGNIKLVVTEDYNLYLDTFKVTHLLSNNNYRHQEVSYDGNYPYDVKRVFKTLPKGEIYKLPAGAYNPKKNSVDYDDQFETCYQYGAETNDDFLYSENMKILAPLYINKVLPDFFCIFRVPECYNIDSYKTTLNDSEVFKSLLTNGKLIKAYDLHKYTSIGQYLINYADMITDIAPAVALQFQEQDRDNDDITSKFKTGTNIWRGISIDRGVITEQQETSYFSNKILEDTVATQERFDAFIVDGFERNNILYPKILNLEFMFNDREAESYKMHKYFGLYLKENDLINFNGAIKNFVENTASLKQYDNNDCLFDDKFLEKYLNNKKFNDRLFFSISKNSISRIKELKEFREIVSNEYANTPSTNVINVASQEVKSLTDAKSFITLHFSKPIKYGEHFRICVKHQYDAETKDYQDYIYEIIASNDERLAHTENNIFPYVQVNQNNKDVENGWWWRSSVEQTEDTSILSDSSIYHNTNIAPGASEEVEDINAYAYNNLINEGKANVSVIVDPATICMYLADTSLSYGAYKAPYNDVEEDLTIAYRNKAVTTFPIIFRIAFYTQDVNDATKAASLEEQIKRIESCIKKFNSDFYVGARSTDSISIISNIDNLYFQHITSDILNIKFSKSGIGIDYSKSYGTDSLSYYNEKTLYNLHPCNFMTDFYDEDTKVFALYGFEVLGSRLSSIVKFVDILPNLYQFKFDFNSQWNSLLVETVNGYFPINEFIVERFSTAVNNNYKIINGDGESVSTESSMLIVHSPFNLNNGLISAPYALSDISHLRLYEPLKYSFSLMGLLNFKDIDTRINTTTSTKITNSGEISFSAGSKIYFKGDQCSLQKLTPYTLKSGAFSNVNIHQGTSFFIDTNNDIYDANGTKFEGFKDDFLFVSTNVILTNEVYKNESDINYTIKTPLLEPYNYYKDPNNIGNSMLQQPILVPTTTQWESQGVYFDNNSILNINDIKARSYQESVTSLDGVFTVQNGISGSSLYVPYSLDSTINYNGEFTSIKDAILSGMSIREYLVSNKVPESTKVFYNKYTESLEFIFYGIKFTLSFNSKEYLNTIRLNEYNNYEIFMINEYDISKNNEIYISLKENIILILNHNFKAKKYQKHSNIFTDKTTTYYWEETPYQLNYGSAYGNDLNLVIPIICNAGKEKFKSKIKDSSVFLECDYLNTDRTESERAYCNNYIAYFNIDKVSLSENENNVLLNYNNQIINTISTDDKLAVSNTLNLDGNKDYLTLSGYSIVKSSSPEIPDIDINENENILDVYADSFNNFIDIYVIDYNSYLKESITDSYRPVTITTSLPKYIKYNSGYFDIHTYDLIDFSLYEDETMREISKSNFMLSNTEFTSIKKIYGAYGMKTFIDPEMSVDINYYQIIEKSIVASNWDKSYYRKYETSSSYTTLDGYIPGIEDKNYFGSKCIVLNDNFINITKWNYSDLINTHIVDGKFNNDSVNYNYAQLEFNLTQILYQYLISENNALISNWQNFTVFSDSVYIKNFIKCSLLKYFNINDKKNFKLYARTKGQNNETIDLKTTMPDDFEENWSDVTNYDANYSNINGDIILTINIKDFKNTAFYPIYTINRQ